MLIFLLYDEHFLLYISYLSASGIDLANLVDNHLHQQMVTKLYSFALVSILCK